MSDDKWREVSREEFAAMLDAAAHLVYDCNAIFEPPVHGYWDRATVRSNDWSWGKESFGYCQEDYDRTMHYYITTDTGLLPNRPVPPAPEETE